MTNHDNRATKWRVFKDLHYTKMYQWGVYKPTDDMYHDCQPRDGFATFVEAMQFAQVEAFKKWYISNLEESLEKEESAVDLMRVLRDYREALTGTSR